MDREAAVAVAAVTKSMLRHIFTLLLIGKSALSLAAVLPEERVDALYHRYDGGGLTVDGPSVLVRKNFADKVSVSGNYYVDNVSSASIDVVTQASKFSDKRTETSLNADYLFDRTMLSAGYINSSRKRLPVENLSRRCQPGFLRRSHHAQHGLYARRQHHREQ